MALELLQNVNFGLNRGGLTGSLGVGFTIIDSSGDVVQPRTTTGVYELVPSSGVYAAYVSYPDDFNGQILWDCPPVTGSQGNMLSSSYAVEAQNVQANDPTVSLTYDLINGTLAPQIQGLYDVAFGRWTIDPVANTMTFYRADNATVVAVFNLYDSDGSPNFNSVFERRLVGQVIP